MRDAAAGKWSRRRFLRTAAAGAAGLALGLGGVAGWHLRRRADQIVAEILRSLLKDSDVAQGSIERFARDYAAAGSEWFRSGRWKVVRLAYGPHLSAVGMLPQDQRDAIYRFEGDLLQQFLFSSRAFLEGALIGRGDLAGVRLEYVSLYDPYRVPCMLSHL